MSPTVGRLGSFFVEAARLNPYEAFVCLEETEWRENYPMDYYSQAGGPWSNYHDETKNRELCSNA